MTQINNLNQNRQAKLPAVTGLRIALFVGFFIAALLVAYLTFVAVRDFVTGWEMTSLPGIALQGATATPAAPDETPVAAVPPLPQAAGPTPPPWDGANRVSVLVMGLDYRDWQAGEGPPRTDTMILFTIDPINRTAGMLSIPRDLWVYIPGFDYGRINTAYMLGEANKLPGGGPQLAADTIEELLGVPVDYYAQVDFSAFVRFIDELGGIEVVIHEEIKIDPMGDGNTKRLKPGKYNLPGDLALAYVRARKTEGGDFDRSQRQQEVVMNIRDRLLEQEGLFPLLLSRAPALYEELSSGIHTNMNLDQAIRLAWLALQIPRENIKQGAIGTDHITFAMSPDGSQQVLKPRTEQIRALRDEIFTMNSSIAPLAASMEMPALLQQEGARVRVLNGSYTAGLAAKTTEYLQAQGINVVETGNAEQLVSGTEITFYSGKPYTLKFLVDLMKISPFRIRNFSDPASPVDITIVVGDDWAQNMPAP